MKRPPLGRHGSDDDNGAITRMEPPTKHPAPPKAHTSLLFGRRRGWSMMMLRVALLFVVVFLGWRLVTPDPHSPTVQSPSLTKPASSFPRQHDKDLPPIVQLSPGAHKYVLVKAEKSSPNHPNENHDIASTTTKTTQWFVKSASPQECGGPYHRYVAKGLVEQLQALGYFHAIEVTGGGRIEYDTAKQHAIVYGYSNRYGRGDHVLAARLINEHSSIRATYNLSNDLY
mmetsp:Transcript_11995/g.23034  ORF Transcript_11995/g.23034 Transcript_11995/m.23034 type:complete len:228 (-) Transcript_11995:235-918(-)|eukprot:scaffold36714_cov214-Amphora_coffeaeformis.AAC.1